MLKYEQNLVIVSQGVCVYIWEVLRLPAVLFEDTN